MFGNRMGFWKWNSIVADLIDIREKTSKNVLYKKVKFFIYNDFFI
jgi:hypothetical protein